MTEDRGLVFSEIADLYDDVRPEYPDELYDAIGNLVGGWPDARTLDLAAGTGIATRAMTGRRARVIALDPGEPMIRRLVNREPVPAVVATGEQLPFVSRSFDVIACATAWHWLVAAAAVPEMARVLKPGGHLALWWAVNKHGGGIDWEDAQSAVIERWQRPRGITSGMRDGGVGPRDVSDDLRARGFDVVLEADFSFDRSVSRETHIHVLATHSNRLILGPGDRDQLLDEIREALEPWPVVTERMYVPLVVARAT